MIFVTLGTQNFNFTRLLEAVESAIENGVIKEKVIAQIGNNDFQSENIECVSFIDKDSFNAYMDEANFVISHAGTGSIISALKKQKKIIVGARLASFDEHIDDHQLEILDAFAKMNLIIPLSRSLEDLEDKIINIKDYNLKTFVSNSSNFNSNLTDLIKNL